MTTVEDFNRLPADMARQCLLSCCSSLRWADAVLAARPYTSVDVLLRRSGASVRALGEADLLAALAGHPRLGDRRPAAGWSSQEQSGIGSADAQVLNALADGNAEYERQFGHIYLACATGRSAPDLLAFLRERLHNDRDTEWGVIAAELAKINQIRLRKLIDCDSNAVSGTATAGGAEGVEV
jgi:2-oxo-4-hydroxy-4-carboxy-5-ureidoimidazoline decarboxylase